MPTTDPAEIRPRRRLATRPGDHTGEALLDVLAKRVVRGQLRDLRTARTSLRVPLRRRRAIRDRVTACGRVAAQLPRDRRPRPIQPASDLAHPDTLRTKNRDLFPLTERQIAPRQWGQRDWRHPATVAEPPAANRLRHPRRRGRLLARAPSRDRPPEPLPILPPRHRRPARRRLDQSHLQARVPKPPGDKRSDRALAGAAGDKVGVHRLDLDERADQLLKLFQLVFML